MSPETWGITSVIAVIAFTLANIAAFITALVTDIIAGDVIWVVVDCVLSPVGVVRGWLMWFGVV